MNTTQRIPVYKLHEATTCTSESIQDEAFMKTDRDNIIIARYLFID